MYKRFIALGIILIFASQILAGEFECAASGDHQGMAEMACCAQAKSAAASPVAMMCCEIVCGETTSGPPGPQSETPGRSPQVPAPAVASGPAIAFDLLLAVAVRDAKSMAYAFIQDHDPPALYLHNSAFLI